MQPILLDNLAKSHESLGFLAARPNARPFPVVNLDLVELDPELVRSIPEHLAQRYKVIPLAQEGNRLMLGMADPSNTIAIDDIQLITGFNICPVQLGSQGGGLPAWDDLQTSVQPLRIFPLTSLAVKARVSGPLASVQIRQTFSNPFDKCIEAVYIFPIYAGAAVHEFRMTVGDRVIEAEIQEKHQARETYAEGIQKGHRAALVEQERDNVLTMTVGNIAPGESLTVEIGYAQRLDCNENDTTLRVPLVVAPRYIPGQPLGVNQGLGIASDTDQVPDASRISPPRLTDGTLAALSIEVELDTAGLLPQYLACSQHATSQTNRQGNLLIELARADELLDRDFVLTFNLGQQTPQGLLLTCADHFLLWIIPPAQLPSQSLSRDVVFLIDRSGSMGGIKMESARRALLNFLGTLNAQDRFALLAFDDRMEFYGQGAWHPASQTDLAHPWIGQHCQARGGTAIQPPIEWLLNRPAHPQRMLCAVLITDGEVGNEAAIYQQLQRTACPVRLFTLGVDTAVNDAFLRQVAALGRGTCELVTPGQHLETALARLAREIGAPLITDISLEDRGLHADLIAPYPIPDLFAARPVVISGTRRGEGDVIVNGRSVDGQPWSARLAQVTSDNPALGILWARQRIRQLEDRVALGTARDKARLESEIRELALEYGLLSKYTSFVLVDRDQVVNPSGQVETCVQPVHLPAQWDPQIDRALTDAFGAHVEVENTVKDISAQDFGPLDEDEEVSLDKLKEMVDLAPIIRVVNLILTQAVQDRASHIHIQPEAKTSLVRYRVDGILQEVMLPPRHVHSPIVARLKSMAGLDLKQCGLPQTGHCEFQHGKTVYRAVVTTCPTIHGEKVVIHLDCLGVPVPLEQLSLPPHLVEQLQKLLALPQGLLLVTGPGNSGRSNLVTSLLGHSAGGRHVLWCDSGPRSGWRQPPEGVTRLSLEPSKGFRLRDMLESARHLDADVLGISGLSGAHELKLAAGIATDGAVVVATWAAPDAASALLSLLEAGLEPQLISNCLLGIVALRRVPTLCGCASGCDKCHMTGINGQTVVSELLLMNDALRGLLAQKPGRVALQKAGGYATLEEQLKALQEAGVINARY